GGLRVTFSLLPVDAITTKLLVYENGGGTPRGSPSPVIGRGCQEVLQGWVFGFERRFKVAFRLPNPPDPPPAYACSAALRLP
ncbi:MAG: hypothetical protein U0236_23710, partial [Nitrospira sp.]